MNNQGLHPTFLLVQGPDSFFLVRDLPHSLSPETWRFGRTRVNDKKQVKFKFGANKAVAIFLFSNYACNLFQ
jgi:hypothetical protein